MLTTKDKPILKCLCPKCKTLHPHCSDGCLREISLEVHYDTAFQWFPVAHTHARQPNDAYSQLERHQHIRNMPSVTTIHSQHLLVSNVTFHLRCLMSRWKQHYLTMDNVSVANCLHPSATSGSLASWPPAGVRLWCINQNIQHRIPALSSVCHLHYTRYSPVYLHVSYVEQPQAQFKVLLNRIGEGGTFMTYIMLADREGKHPLTVIVEQSKSYLARFS